MKLKEIMIADDIMEIVADLVAEIKAGSRDVAELMKLEKCAKVYATIMASNRENLKAGLLGNLSDEELSNSGGGDEDSE